MAFQKWDDRGEFLVKFFLDFSEAVGAGLQLINLGGA